MIYKMNATIEEKLEILSDAAKYDVACTSSGVQRKAEKGKMGNTCAGGICHTFSADGRCISLLKILYTNECVFDCKYCINRASNDVPRVSFTPDEVCRLTMEFYQRNYIEGLFLSSGVKGTPNDTMEEICRTLHDLREVYGFGGYIHCKAIPGASPELVELAGWYADRMSINMELPTTEGLKRLAPNKTRKTILTPMRQIQNGIAESQYELGMKGGNKGAYWHTQRRLERKEIHKAIRTESKGMGILETKGNIPERKQPESSLQLPDVQGQSRALTLWNHPGTKRGFVPAGQSSQMIIGASGESDYEIMSVSQALYEKFDLKRVFYSAFININQDTTLPSTQGGPSLTREHRLYQADWLLRYYGFGTKELLSEQKPNFNLFLDPKCDWALRNLSKFPVEVATADYDTLLRVPGIGMKSARRILAARRTGRLDYESLKKMGVVLKRAIYFITCNGRMQYDCLKIEEDYITRNLLHQEQSQSWKQGFSEESVTYRQLSLFDVASFSQENKKISSM